MMRKIVCLTLGLLFIGSAAGAPQFALTVVFQGGDIVNATLSIEDGRANRSTTTDQGPYTAALKSYNNTYLMNKSFSPPEVMQFGDPDWFAENGTQMVTPNQSTIAVPVSQNIYFPYRPTVEQIEVYRAEKKITAVSAAQYATCNLDGVCGSGESAARCPADCATPSGGLPIKVLVALGVIAAAVIYFSIEP